MAQWDYPADNPQVRMAFRASDVIALVEKLDGWDHPVYFRLRAKLAEAGFEVGQNPRARR